MKEKKKHTTQYKKTPGQFSQVLVRTRAAFNIFVYNIPRAKTLTHTALSQAHPGCQNHFQAVVHCH